MFTTITTLKRITDTKILRNIIAKLEEISAAVEP